MPSFVTPAKRRSGEDVELDDDEDFETPATSTSSTKRQRFSQRALTTTRKEHQPGAIVRVWLKNFVTYKDAEFFPGSSLNMVIGPNGNGKSTLVCAICLGLGWGSQHLGRAKDAGDFVKHGASEGVIEIELKRDGKKYKSNPIIRATIKKDSNKITFMLNGKQSSRKICQEIAKSFAIQVDNLCQFLPQDRVVEFASLSPVELLKSTQRAIASEEMIDWHEQLISLGKSQKDVAQSTKAETENLKSLENRQRMQEADVQRLREREAIKKNVELLEAVKPIVGFVNIKKQLEEAKLKHREAQNDLTDLTAREAPALRAVNDEQTYMNTVKSARDSLNRKCVVAEQNVTAMEEEISNCDQRAKLHETRTEDRKRTLRDTKVDIKRLDGIITNLRTEFEQGQPDFDLAAVQEHIREIARQRNTMKDEAEHIRREQSDLNAQMTAKNAEANNLEQQIKNLDSQTGKQEQKLKSANIDTWKAWEWVQKNQDKFEKPILGPPVVECSVNTSDPKFADMLESLIQQGDMFTFTAQTQADQREFHRLIKDEHGWKKTNTRCAPNVDRLRAPMSHSEIQALGFEGWARDFIQGPEPIINMLCEAANLHRTGVCPREQTKAQFNAAERSSVTGWVTPVSSYRVMRRAEYGASAISTTVRDVRKALYWTDQPIDSSVKDAMLQNVNALRQDIAILREEFHESNRKVEASQKRYKELQDKEKTLAQEKEQGLKAQKRFLGLETRINNEESKRKDLQDTVHEIQRTFMEKNDELDEIYFDRAQATLGYADMILAYQSLLAEAEAAEIMVIEAESDFKVLSERSRNVKDMLQARKMEVDELAKLKEDVKNRGRNLQRDVTDLRRKADTDEQLADFMSTFDGDIPLEQHDQAIEDANQRLGLMHDGNAGAIKQFMEREKAIERLKIKLDALNLALEEVTVKLTETRNKWEPKLDALIGRISSSFAYNMGQINCNGEVAVYKHEDFEQWAIEIFVRFREGEPMTRLDAHRQSGGERAVSTIFYLMSLQTLTRSPFRVVDEINQGMDPRNERLVHSRMVAIATGNDDWQPPSPESDGGDDMDQIIRQVDVERADLGTSSGSQYFLVTPKLLHDLRYEEGMTVMCINSGEHLASGEDMDVKQVSFAKSLEAHRAMQGRLTAVGA